MDVINHSGLLFAPLVGRIGFPGHSLTMIVKGTFDMQPEGPAILSKEQLFPTGNELYEDDEDGNGCSRYESDFAYFKPKSDLLLAGKYHAPENKPVRKSRVSFQVGEQTKTLDITGDRYKQGAFNSITVAEPFSELELRYENSYGGVSNKRNPVGKGEEKSQKEGEAKLWPLANIDNTQRSSEPAGFGPLGSNWKDRASKMGTYKGAWLKERWPWFPKDFDWGYFNAAPSDMQVEGYLKGDEPLFFENLHPVCSQYRAQLPGIRIRLFLHELKQGTNENQFKEVKLNLDTLWVDMEAEKLVLVWRGISPVQSEDCEEIQQVFICSEKMSEAVKSVEYYHEYFLCELNKEDIDDEDESPAEPEPEVSVDVEIAAAEEALKVALLEEGLDPENLPEPTPEQRAEEARLLNDLGVNLGDDPLTAEQLMLRYESGDEFVDKNLKCMNLSERDLRLANFHSSILAGACFKRSNLAGAVLSECDLSKADLSGSNLQGANLKEADLTGANLDGSDLTGALLDDAIFENASVQGAVLEKVSARCVNFSEANLKQAKFADSNLKEGNFSKARLDLADFQGANLFAASVIGASGKEINMTGADISELRAAECDFSHGIFTKTEGKESIWEAANLTHADFSYSKMEGADFTSANLSFAKLNAADMKFSRFSRANLCAAECVQMNLFQGSLEKANLAKTNFRGSNLYGVEFLEAIVKETHFDLTNLKMTKLA